MEPVDRDRWLDDALGALPAPRAPRTLLPRVLAMAAELQPRPWYTRTWLTWPRAWQAASVVALALVIGVGAILWPFVGGAFNTTADLASPAVTRLVGWFDQAAVIPALVRVLWRSLLQPVALIAFAISIIGVLTGAAGWSAVNRLAFHREGAVHP